MSTDRDNLQEKCPKCGQAHTRGPYVLHPADEKHPRGFYSPYDVKCVCGLALRWSVPIFKTNASGYVLRVLRDDETPFFKEPG